MTEIPVSTRDCLAWGFFFQITGDAAFPRRFLFPPTVIAVVLTASF